MPKITKRWVDALKKPARDTVYWDDELKGFGVRLTPAGSIAYLIQYRDAKAKSRRLTIGSHGVYTVSQARDEAKELLHSAALARRGAGKDPIVLKREARDAITFAELANEYLDKAASGLFLTRGRKAKKASTLAIDRYRMPHLVRHFRDKPVKDISQADCRRLLERLIAGKHGASRTYGLLGGILSYAVAQGHLQQNPAHGVPTPADAEREFRLDANGYRSLGVALEQVEARGESWRAVAAVYMLALTGCRKSEILRLRLSEVDLPNRCLRLGDSKTGAATRVLGEAAIRILRVAINRPGRPSSAYLLPGRDPRKPFNGLGGAWLRIVGAGYTPHSLRHAFASACDEVDLSELTIAMLLGHASARKGSTTRGYISKPDAVLLAAADKVSRHIWQAMTGKTLSAEVVELRPPTQVA